MKKTQIRLTDEQYQRLKGVAAGRGVPISQLIREAIDRHVAVENPGDRRERAVRAIGGFHSARVDVSDKHDRYLSDTFGV